MRWRTILAAVALATLSACGGGGDEGPAETPPETSPPAQGVEAVPVVMIDNSFSPPGISMPTGTAIEARNQGQAGHTFTIADEGIDVEVGPGETVTIDDTADLDAGSYAFVCRFHEAQGMVGSLQVEG